MTEVAQTAAGLDVSAGIARCRIFVRGDLLCAQRLHASDALLDVEELGAVAAIAAFPGQSGDFLRHRLGAISRIRVVAEKLRPSRHATLSLQLGEKIRHRPGIKA